MAEVRVGLAHLEVHLVAKLEESLARSPRPPEKVLDLAAWYSESGRAGDALALCRKGWQINPQSLPMCEGLARGLVSNDLPSRRRALRVSRPTHSHWTHRALRR